MSYSSGMESRSKKFNYDDYAGLDVKGKIVLAMRFEPHNEKGKSRFAKEDWSEEAHLTRKAQVAAKHGAAALVLVNPLELSSWGDDADAVFRDGRGKGIAARRAGAGWRRGWMAETSGH